MKKLVIISHTAHQLNAQQQPVGWGPTIREINYLARHWDTLVHVACLDQKTPQGSSVGYDQNNIHFVSIPPFGGAGMSDKLTTFLKVPGILRKIHREVSDATEVQIRLPMGLGLFLIAYFILFRKKSYTLWIKYAGDWGRDSNSMSSRLQKKLLINKWLDCKVTINGNWPDQPEHCLSFNNPCITDEQFREGEAYVTSKGNTGPFTLIFVGRIEAAKGIDMLMEALNEDLSQQIGFFHVVGDGPLMEPLREKLTQWKIKHTMHGFMPQEAVVDLYKEAHFLVLPSRSEGFPKVVAEALNYACLPIVSQVGSISHTIKEDVNGFLMHDLSPKSLQTAMHKALHAPASSLQTMKAQGRSVAESFTYSAYLNDLKTKVFTGK